MFLSFLFPLPFQTFSHSFFFQFNCYPIGCASCLPSVNQGNNGPPPPSLPASHVEKAMAVSFPLVFIFSSIPIFSHIIFFQFNCYSVGSAGGHPSVKQGNKGPPQPSPPASRVEKAVMVCLSLVLIFSTVPIFSHSIFFQFNCYPIGRAGCLPSVNQGNKGPSPQSPPAGCM